MNPTILDKAP